mmetsp:Transcript_150833/g.262757  ORF Transcript_150833/g.262757 Transcript_150833/m.262757 type:complete len:82 (-) Transcript_150833:2027-2272(-)
MQVPAVAAIPEDRPWRARGELVRLTPAPSATSTSGTEMILFVPRGLCFLQETVSASADVFHMPAADEHPPGLPPSGREQSQ